jgi:hypothetical protein
LSDIKAIVDSQCQTDPTFRTQRLYSRLTAAAIRRTIDPAKRLRGSAITDHGNSSLQDARFRLPAA